MADLDELTEHIRRAARRHGGSMAPVSHDSLLRGELPPVPRKLPAPPSPTLGSGAALPGTPAREVPLEEVAHMAARARAKTEVAGGVPALLRPLYRNQGGFNGIVVEAIERLIEMNQHLRSQNAALQDRLVALHGWMDAAAKAQARQRDWTLAADARLRAASPERISQLEERLRRLEARGAQDPA